MSDTYEAYEERFYSAYLNGRLGSGVTKLDRARWEQYTKRMKSLEAYRPSTDALELQKLETLEALVTQLVL